MNLEKPRKKKIETKWIMHKGKNIFSDYKLKLIRKTSKNLKKYIGLCRQGN